MNGSRLNRRPGQWLATILAGAAGLSTAHRALGDDPRALRAQAIVATESGDLPAADNAYASLAAAGELNAQDAVRWIEGLLALGRLDEAVGLSRATDGTRWAGAGVSARVAASARRPLTAILEREQARRAHLAEASEAAVQMIRDSSLPLAPSDINWHSLSRASDPSADILADQLSLLQTVDERTLTDLLEHPEYLGERIVNLPSLADLIASRLDTARRAMEAGQTKAGYALIDQLRRFIPNADLEGMDRQRTFLEAKDAFQAGHLDRAASLWRQCNESNPAGPVLLPYLALVAWSRGDTDNARRLLDDYLRALPSGQFSKRVAGALAYLDAHEKELTRRQDLADVADKNLDIAEGSASVMREQHESRLREYMGLAATRASRAGADDPLAPSRPGFYFHVMRTDNPGGYIPIGPFDSAATAEAARGALLRFHNPYTLEKLGLTVAFAASGVFEVGQGSKRSTASADDANDPLHGVEDIDIEALVLNLASWSHIEMVGHGVEERRAGGGQEEKTSDIDVACQRARRSVEEATREMERLDHELARLRITHKARKEQLDQYRKSSSLIASGFALLADAVEKTIAVEGVQSASLDLWTADAWQIESLLRKQIPASAVGDYSDRQLKLPDPWLAWSQPALVDLRAATEHFMDARLVDVPFPRPTFLDHPHRVRVFGDDAAGAGFGAPLATFKLDPVVLPTSVNQGSKKRAPESTKASVVGPWFNHARWSPTDRRVSADARLIRIGGTVLLAQSHGASAIATDDFHVEATGPIAVAMGRLFVSGSDSLSILGPGLEPTAKLSLPCTNPVFLGSSSDELLLAGALSDGAALYRIRSDGSLDELARFQQTPTGAARVEENVYAVTDGDGVYRLDVGKSLTRWATMGLIHCPRSIAASHSVIYVAGCDGLHRIWSNGVVQRLDRIHYDDLAFSGDSLWGLSIDPLRVVRFQVRPIGEDSAPAETAMQAYLDGQSSLYDGRFAEAARSFDEALEAVPQFEAAWRSALVCRMRRFPSVALATLAADRKWNVADDLIIRAEDAFRLATFDVAEKRAMRAWADSAVATPDLILLHDLFGRLGMPIPRDAAKRRLDRAMNALSVRSP